MSREVCIRYLNKEAGTLCVSGTMSLSSARTIVESGHYAQAEIVLDEEGWPPLERETPADSEPPRKPFIWGGA